MSDFEENSLQLLDILGCSSNNLSFSSFNKILIFSSGSYIVYATSFINSVIREKHFTPLYLLLSGLFCRENLNLHFYKFTLEKDINKKNIPLLKENKSFDGNLNKKI